MECCCCENNKIINLKYKYEFLLYEMKAENLSYWFDLEISTSKLLKLLKSSHLDYNYLLNLKFNSIVKSELELKLWNMLSILSYTLMSRVNNINSHRI